MEHLLPTEDVTLLHNSARGARRLLLRSLWSFLLSRSLMFFGLPDLLAGNTKPLILNRLRILDIVDFDLPTMFPISLTDMPPFCIPTIMSCISFDT